MSRWALLIAALAAACGGETAAPTPPDSEPVTEAPKAPADGSQGVYAEMTVVDLDGRPLAGMMPIACREPNAFDQPVARGALTDDKGHSAFTLPQGQRLFVRAWDPDLRMFANNFYEVPAMQGTSTAPMTVAMVPASQLEATLSGPDGQPVAGADAEALLVHPTQGPWWPARGATDGAGRVRFAPVPPGEYIVELNVPKVGTARTAPTFLPPSQSADLGLLRLQ